MLIRTCILLGLVLAPHGPGFARAEALAAGISIAEDVMPDEFYSGSVQDFTETSVTVTRSLPGKNLETRVFVLDAETKVEGKLKKLARVTVGYHTHEGQDVAWRIIVRESPE